MLQSPAGAFKAEGVHKVTLQFKNFAFKKKLFSN